MQEPYRDQGFDLAALYLVAKLVLGGAGNGVWLSMVRHVGVSLGVCGCDA